MRYYRVPRATDAGELLSQLLDDMIFCDKEAEIWVAGVGGEEWVYSTKGDHGGVGALSFPAGKEAALAPHVWEEVWRSADGVAFYEPKVTVRTAPVLANQALRLRPSVTRRIHPEPCTFRQVSPMLSLQEVATMAHYRLTGDEAADAEYLTQHFATTEFRLVTYFKGHQRAIRHYDDMIELPVIPTGTINRTCGIADETHLAGLRLCGDNILLCSHNDVPCTLSDAIELTPEEYQHLTPS